MYSLSYRKGYRDAYRSFTEQVLDGEFRREPSAFYWVVFIIIWMLALGFAFSEPKPEVYGLGWPADKNVSELSSKISQVLENDSKVRLYKTVEENLETLSKRDE